MFGESYKDAVSMYGSTSDKKWWINAEDFPVKCAVVGKEVVGCARFGRKGQVSATKDEGGKLRFAVNVFDGKRCRVLEGSQSLYDKLVKLGRDSAGLENIWVEIGKTGDEKTSPYYAKFAGELTAKDKAARDEAQQENLQERCSWLDDVSFPD